MAVKDLLLVMSEMLIKQDQTNDTLQKFMDVTVKQFNEQAKFNDIFLSELKGVKSELVGVQGELGGIKSELVGVNQRLDKVEAAISNFSEFDDRLKRQEAIVLKS